MISISMEPSGVLRTTAEGLCHEQPRYKCRRDSTRSEGGDVTCVT